MTPTSAQVDPVYRAHKMRVACEPEGRYDHQSRWYTSRREAGSGLYVRAPSAAYEGQGRCAALCTDLSGAAGGGTHIFTTTELYLPLSPDGVQGAWERDFREDPPAVPS